MYFAKTSRLALRGHAGALERIKPIGDCIVDFDLNQQHGAWVPVASRSCQDARFLWYFRYEEEPSRWADMSRLTHDEARLPTRRSCRSH